MSAAKVPSTDGLSTTMEEGGCRVYYGILGNIPARLYVKGRGESFNKVNAKSEGAVEMPVCKHKILRVGPSSVCHCLVALWSHLEVNSRIWFQGNVHINACHSAHVCV